MRLLREAGRPASAASLARFDMELVKCELEFMEATDELVELR